MVDCRFKQYLCRILYAIFVLKTGSIFFSDDVSVNLRRGSYDFYNFVSKQSKGLAFISYSVSS